MQHFLQTLHTALSPLYPQEERQVLGMILLEHITRLPRVRLLADRQLTLSSEQRDVANNYLERLRQHEPIQYIVGQTEFYGLTFSVNPSVLIPRPETEELVEWIISDIVASSIAPRHLLDIGTGSGCIAVALAKRLPNVSVTAIDSSMQALEVARANAHRHGLRISFFCADALQLPSPDVWGNEAYDVIVSNPPYIPRQESATLAPHVARHEPPSALFVPDDDPLLFYRNIAEWSIHRLTPGGKLYFETHKDFASHVKRLLTDIGFVHAQLRNDMSGNGRMVRGEKSPSSDNSISEAPFQSVFQ